MPLPLPEELGPLTGGSRNSDFRAVARDALEELSLSLTAALTKTKDPLTRAHLKDCKREVEDILKTKGGGKDAE